MRPGRFKENNFNEIYENIKNFSKIRKRENHLFQEQKFKWS